MKASATTLPRRSASATVLPSCEVSAKGGAVPITGKRLSPSAACAAGSASTAKARKNARISLPHGELQGENRSGAGFVGTNSLFIRYLRPPLGRSRDALAGEF